MSYLFTLLIGSLLLLAVFHFTWSSIVMPTYRQVQRNKLFALRDQVRLLHLKGGLKENEFELVHDLLNYHISHLSQLQLSSLWAFRREYERSESFRNQINKQYDSIRSVSNPELSKVVEDTADICKTVFLLNSGGWLIFIIPAIMAIVFTSSIRQFALKQVTHAMYASNESRSGLKFSY